MGASEPWGTAKRAANSYLAEREAVLRDAPSPQDLAGLYRRVDQPLLVVRRSFVEALAETEVRERQRSPLTLLLGEGRGWERGVQLKVFLALLWLRTSLVRYDGVPAEHQVEPRRLAELLGLDHPTVETGIRDVNEAIIRLAEKKFLEVPGWRSRGVAGPSGKRVSVRGDVVIVRNEDLRGTPHNPPTDDERWFAIGAEFFTLAWVARMPGPALAAFLILRARMRLSGRTQAIWIARNRLQQFHGISAVSFRRGTNWLEDQKLIELVPVTHTGRQVDRRRQFRFTKRTFGWLDPFQGGRSKGAESPAQRRAGYGDLHAAGSAIAGGAYDTPEPDEPF